MNNKQFFAIRIEDTDDNGKTEYSEKLYSFRNSYDLSIKIGDIVSVHVGKVRTADGEVVDIAEYKEGIKYKDIIEVHNRLIKQEKLLKGNRYVADVRLKSDGVWGYKVVTCLYDIPLKIYDIVMYHGEQGKVVNLRQLSVEMTVGMEKVEKKKGLLSRLFS
ncbi:hypothetical protein [Paenibacillus silvisoli]|uniref:hypothetical protein n=1 Tax=Paenibacillus silvisoli TaxID=3110539 RepID=UPI002805CCBB|nr:hypothetical protein [Paenibacillus silvisoli]